MPYYLIYLVPFVAAAVAMAMSGATGYWWADLLIATAVAGLMHLVYRLLSTTKEYLSGYVSSAEHDFAWTERVIRTETREVNGKTVTETKEELVEHPDQYYWYINTGKLISVSYRKYSMVKALWGTEAEFVSVSHVNCVAGGDGERIRWNGREYAAVLVTYRHRYRNPVRYSHSIFGDKYITRGEARRLNLIDYPKVRKMQEDVILAQRGLKVDFSDSDQDYVRRINAFHGMRNQIHVFVLLFSSSEDIGIAYKQRSYWKGLNKNEFVICLGMDGREVKWCQPLSWMDEPSMEVWTRRYFLEHPQLDFYDFSYSLRDNLDKWHRKEFSDFKYLGNNLSNSHSIILMITVLLMAVGTFAACWYISFI